MSQLLKMCRLTNFLIWCSFGFMLSISASPAKRSSLLLDDATIHTETVGLNNRQEVLAKFNLTEAMMSRIYAGISAATMEAEADGRTMQYFKKLREFRVNDIKNRISNAIQNVHSDENQEQHPLHEMAAYPTCNSETTESSWLQDNNITIQFSQTLFEQRNDLNLDSAILRLYKINPNATNDQSNADSEKEETTADNSKEVETQAEESVAGKLKRCVKPIMDAQIRVTVSLVQQLRRNKRGVYERKKRICNIVMMNVTQTGWVEIDIKRAIYIWEEKLQQTQPTRPTVLVGWLMIEVHDEEEQPLKPGLFFKPPNCNQADIAIPWNYYRPDTAMPTFATHDVPRYPRLDVKMIGYASFAPINQRHTEQGDKLYANLKLRVFNITAAESTTYIAPTADNHLDSYDNTALIRVKNEMQQQQRDHPQHKRHLKLTQIKQQLEEEKAKEMPDNEMIEYLRPQHKHKHHRHHNRQPDDETKENIKHVAEQQHQHHQHARYEEHYSLTAEDKQLFEIEQQQHDAKLLEHIAHKLQQEEKQLYLLHHQQHSTTETYDI